MTARAPTAAAASLPLSLVHAVIQRRPLALLFLRHKYQERVMRRLVKYLIPLSLMVAAMTGCVVAPAGYYHRGYYGPRVAVIAPAPVVVIRPYR
jgi:hypothetical protein